MKAFVPNKWNKQLGPKKSLEVIISQKQEDLYMLQLLHEVLKRMKSFNE